MSGTNLGRLEALLWFMQSLVYHDRAPAEHEPLVELIRSTVRNSMQPEVEAMSKTIAQALREEGKQEGEIKGRRELFLLQLRARFKTVPESIVAEVEATTDIHQFDVWGTAFATANSLADIPFKGQP